MILKRILLIFGVLFFGILFVGSVHAQEKVAIRSASELDYPPFCVVTEEGKADGFSVNLLREALKAMDLEVTFYVGPWSQVKQDLVNGKIQVLPVVGRTPEREEVYDFTFPYITFYGAVFVREGDTSINSVEDLRNKEVLVMGGDNAEEYVRRENISNNIITTNTYEEAFRLLSQGEHDAVIAQKRMGTNLLKGRGIKNVVVSVKLDEFRQDFTFAVKEGDSELLAILNEGLSAVIADGTFNELYGEWFQEGVGGKIKTNTSLEVVKYVLVGLSVLFLFIVFVFLIKRRLKS